MEYIDLFNEQMEPLHKSIPRTDVVNQEDYFFIVHVWLRNQEGKYLIQQRNKLSDPRPYMWATTMGIVESGFTTEESALQEVKEELGITYSKGELKRIARYKTISQYANHFTDVYVIDTDKDIRQMTLQESEVKNVKYVKIDTVYDMIKEGNFWDYQKMLHIDEYFINLEKSE